MASEVVNKGFEQLKARWRKIRTTVVQIKLLKWSGISVELGLLVLQSYLTDVWNLSFTNAAGILNIWGGMSMVLQVFLLFLVDAYLSHFRMLVITSVAYTLGIGLISMSIPPIFASFSDGASKEYDASCIGHTQKYIFYTGMVLVAIGISGHQVSLDPFLEEQKPTRDLGPSVEEINHVPNLDPSVEEQNPWLDLDPSVEEQNPTCGDLDPSVMEQNPTHDHLDPSPEMQNPTHNNVKLSRWILLIIKQIVIGVLIPVVGTLVLPLKELWWVCFGVPAAAIAVATLLFLSGWCSYTINNKAEGSPLTSVCRVFVAAASNISQPLPIYEENNEQQEGQSPRLKCMSLRCLEKATIDTSPENPQTESRWKHCSVTEVEEAKTAIRMMPVCTVSIICGVVSSIGNTYFIEQANHLSRQVGRFNIPLPVMLLFLTWVKNLFREYIGKGSINIEPNMGSSTVVVLAAGQTITCCVAAGGVETRRLSVIKKHALLDKPDEDIPMSIFWLVFQFLSLGAMEVLYEKGMSTFYEKESPKSMKNYIACFIKGVTGLGYMFGVFLVYVVGQVSESGGKPNWFQFTLNRSRLDLYYWTLAVLSYLYYLLFVVACSFLYGSLRKGFELY